jgi:hypothetical protein
VRTTVDIEPGLLARVKKLGQKQGQTLSALVSEALAAYLNTRRDSPREQPFELLVRGKAGDKFPSAAELAAAQDEDDRASLQLPGVKPDATP